MPLNALPCVPYRTARWTRSRRPMKEPTGRSLLRREWPTLARFHMSHRSLGGPAVAIGLLLMVSNAWAENRVALVIGNSEYQSVGRLANPASDANAVTKALQATDFDVQ